MPSRTRRCRPAGRLGGRPGDAGGGDADVGAEDPLGAGRHLLRAGAADDLLGGDVEQVAFDVGRVRRDRPAERGAGAGDVGDAGADQPAGERFGNAERPAAGLEAAEHRVLHRLVVDAEDEVAEHAAEGPLLGLDQLAGFGVGGGFGGEAHVEPFDPAGEEGDGRVGLGLDPVGDHLGEPRFGGAPGLEGSRHDDGSFAGPLEEVGQHIVGDHLLHLVGDARHRVDDSGRAADRHLAAQPGGGADGVGDDAAADGDLGLAQVVRRHVSTPGAEQGCDVLDELGAAFEGGAHHLGDRLAGDVVGGGPEAAAHDDRVGAAEQLTERGDHSGEVVADFAVLEGVDPRARELLADPGAVRVDDLAE